MPSGTQSLIAKRIGWARKYLKKAGLLESKKWGYFNIRKRGLEVPSRSPTEANLLFLRQYTEFVEWQRPKQEPSITEDAEQDQSEAPEELIGLSFEKLNQDFATELMETVKNCTPLLLECLIIDLLLRIGYGGTRRDAGQAISQAN